MPDLTPEAIDALVKRLRDKIADAEAEHADDMEQGRYTGERPDLGEYGIILDLTEARQTADALTAIRGGQVAMRERAAQTVRNVLVGNPRHDEARAIAVAAIRALPLDAPVLAVDPVAEAARDNGFLELIVDGMAEADRAMRKFPQPNYVISKFAEEAGEVVKAAIHCAEGRETAHSVRGEMRQVIAMMYRLWVEGDQVHGLRALAQENRHE